MGPSYSNGSCSPTANFLNITLSLGIALESFSGPGSSTPSLSESSSLKLFLSSSSLIKDAGPSWHIGMIWNSVCKLHIVLLFAVLRNSLY